MLWGGLAGPIRSETGCADIGRCGPGVLVLPELSRCIILRTHLKDGMCRFEVVSGTGKVGYCQWAGSKPELNTFVNSDYISVQVELKKHIWTAETSMSHMPLRV